MNEKIILLSDHTWYAVYDKEQAQKIVNNHKWTNGLERTSLAYDGIYIEPSKFTLLFYEATEEGKVEQENTR